MQSTGKPVVYFPDPSLPTTGGRGRESKTVSENEVQGWVWTAEGRVKKCDLG